jgi:hypothetical protein
VTRQHVTGLARIGQRIARTSRQRRRQRAVELLRSSALFDQDWYLATYPDVERSGVDPIVHYLEFGWKEGRDPGPRFSTSAYLRANSDVVALGVNPLLHYVEYGHSEGRGAPEHGAPAPSPVRPREAFGPAALVPSFPLEARGLPRWRRGGRAAVSGRNGFTLNGYFICDLPNAKARSELDEALARLAFLCGGSAGRPEPGVPRRTAAPALADAWFAASNRLRSRWRPSGVDPIVVRMIQHAGEAPALVGERLIMSELDVADAVLANPMFPLLFLFTTANGTLIGTQLMTFPSMCRGGLHYPELLALDHDTGVARDTVDVLGVMNRLGAELSALREGSQPPLVRDIEVDLAEADGTYPIFQPDFQAWLERVLRVPVEGIGASDGVAAEYLAEAAKVSADGTRSGGAATLRIGSDMVPAISALVAHLSLSGLRNAGISVIIAHDDPAVPAVSLSLPGEAARQSASGFGRAYPSLGGADGGGILAIRRAGTPVLSEAQMLVPVAAPELEVRCSKEPLTWIVPASCEREQEVLQCLEALAAQTGTGPTSIVFVGQPGSIAQSLARRLFKGRVQVATGFERAARAVQTPFVGYIASNVILHDCRTAAFLCGAIGDESLATASVVLVTAENRGKESVVAPADAGEILIEGPVTRQQMQRLVSLLWRSNWPVARPPRDLWLTRTASLVGWLSATRPPELEQTHLCTYQLSASYPSRQIGKEPEFTPPRSAVPAMNGELLYG